MRKRINKLFAHAKKPFNAVYRWATRPKEIGKRLRRFAALLDWARARKRKPGDKFALAAKAYRKKVKWLREHSDPKPPPSHGNFTTFDGLQVPTWIAEIAQKVRNAGVWSGTIISGYRSPEYSEQLCYQMCGAPSCPGRCAGRSSNHCCPPTFTGVEPEGAIDVTDYVTFANELQRLGFWDVLKNDLPSDRVHFSRSGH